MIQWKIFEIFESFNRCVQSSQKKSLKDFFDILLFQEILEGLHTKQKQKPSVVVRSIFGRYSLAFI